jgi:hypothetical protein
MCFKNKKDETGWLIERSVDPDRMGRRYIGVVCGHLCWQTHEWAIRFAREFDANRMIDGLKLTNSDLFDGEETHVSEHVWSNFRPDDN